MIIYFSGTGNSKFCAESIAQHLNCDIINSFDYIDKEKSLKLISKEPWIFICPTYGWRIPIIFEELISRSDFRGNKDAYFIMTCGSEIGSPGKYLERLCKEKGFNYKGVFEIKMPENYLAMFDIPSEEEIIDIINSAKQPLIKAAESIRKDENFYAKKTTALDKIKSNIINPLFHKFFVKAKLFHVKGTCIGCGKCIDVCPLKNIQMENGKPIWKNRCTHCMACICSCPKESIEYGKKSIGKLRYNCNDFVNIKEDHDNI